jgi:hypothetical protein
MSANTQDSKRTADDVRQAFSGLPFDQKVSTLIRVELDMLGDAVETVVSAAAKVVDDIATACSKSSSTKPASDGQASTT